MRDNKTLMRAIWILSVLLLIALSYISYEVYQKVQLEKQNVAASYGYQLGYSDAVASLMQQASTCQTVPITLGNQTLNLIALECFEK